jgi:MFS family permease
MSKTTVTRLFIGSGIAVIVGAILAVGAVWLAIANDAFIMSGPDIVGFRGGELAWIGLGLGFVGALIFTGGMIGGFVSWAGALLNTWRVESKTWFAILLLLGVFTLGFFAMVAYVIAGPDGMVDVARPRAQTPAAA